MRMWLLCGPWDLSSLTKLIRVSCIERLILGRTFSRVPDLDSCAAIPSDQNCMYIAMKTKLKNSS